MYNIIMISSLILQLSRGIWFIDPKAAEAYKPIVQAILTGKEINLSALLPKSYADEETGELRKTQKFVTAVKGQPYSIWNDMSKAPAGSIAVTPLKGVIMKDNYCGSPGQQTLAQWMQEADQNSNVIGHILDTDTPGGAANGNMDFDNAVKSLDKPVVTFVNGMCASAGVWSVSGSKHIMAANTLCQIGSIGTYQTIQDWTGYDEKNGIKELDVYATEATKKNLEYRQAQEYLKTDGAKGSLAPLLAQIDVFNTAFTDAVTRNRYGKSLNKDKTLHGQIMFAQEAIDNGLIDSIGNFQQAINKVIQLSKN